MLQYVKKVIIPYVEYIQGSFDTDTAELVIMDNFKGQVVGSVTNLLELNNIHVCLLPPNMTDKLQPMDISVNKPVKDFLKWQFEDWYSQKVSKQLSDKSNIHLTNLQPINLGLPVVKELGAKWMVEMSKYLQQTLRSLLKGLLKQALQEHWTGKRLVMNNKKRTMRPRATLMRWRAICTVMWTVIWTVIWTMIWTVIWDNESKFNNNS